MLFSSSGGNSDDSDQELLQQFRRHGDLGQLGVLYNRYVHLVYGVALKYLKNRDDSQDAVMQIFEKLIKDVPRFEIKKFSSWLYVYSKNHCLMQIRSRKSRLAVKEIDALEKDMESELDLHHDNEQVNLESNLQALEECIEMLPDNQKECVRLFFLKEQSYRQIVETAGHELKKVKSYIQNGKRNLRNCLDKKVER